jgi:hypothetical protein
MYQRGRESDWLPDQLYERAPTHGGIRGVGATRGIRTGFTHGGKTWHPAHRTYEGSSGPFHPGPSRLDLDRMEVHDVVESRVLFRTGRLEVLPETLSDEALIRELRRLSDESSDE